MGKKSVTNAATGVDTNKGLSARVEQTVTVDDNYLPSPQELQAYKEVDPRIVDFLINSSKAEQEHRHATEKEKIKIIKKSEGRKGRINFFGMFFAFMSITVLTGVTAYALYLDKPWIAAFMGGTTIVAVASIFIKKDTPDSKRK